MSVRDLEDGVFKAADHRTKAAAMTFVDDALELPEPSVQCVLQVETRLSDEVEMRYPARPVGAKWQSRFPAETVENRNSEIPIAKNLLAARGNINNCFAMFTF